MGSLTQLFFQLFIWLLFCLFIIFEKEINNPPQMVYRIAQLCYFCKKSNNNICGCYEIVWKTIWNKNRSKFLPFCICMTVSEKLSTKIDFWYRRRVDTQSWPTRRKICVCTSKNRMHQITISEISKDSRMISKVF